MTETGRTLRALRHDAGLSLRALAKIIGCSAAFLCDVELGHRKLPSRWIDRLTDAIQDSETHQFPEAMQEPIRRALIRDVVAEAEAKLERLG